MNNGDSHLLNVKCNLLPFFVLLRRAPNFYRTYTEINLFHFSIVVIFIIFKIMLNMFTPHLTSCTFHYSTLPFILFYSQKVVLFLNKDFEIKFLLSC